MFTGIVEETGRVVAFTREAQAWRLQIKAAAVLEGLALGDSIAINGACMTATTLDVPGRRFTVDVSAESLARTAGLDRPGPINLEKALRLADRLGGHLVSGHVDGVGTVVRFDPVGDNRLLEISAPEELAKYIARKGSITVSGVSLTTNAVDGCRFAINLIPHTLASTTLGGIRAGDRVNLEIDLIARYVERMLNPEAEPAQNA